MALLWRENLNEEKKDVQNEGIDFDRLTSLSLCLRSFINEYHAFHCLSSSFVSSFKLTCFLQGYELYLFIAYEYLETIARKGREY